MTKREIFAVPCLIAIIFIYVFIIIFSVKNIPINIIKHTRKIEENYIDVVFSALFYVLFLYFLLM